jgi:hypothetical protein
MSLWNYSRLRIRWLKASLNDDGNVGEHYSKLIEELNWAFFIWVTAVLKLHLKESRKWDDTSGNTSQRWEEDQPERKSYLGMKMGEIIFLALTWSGVPVQTQCTMDLWFYTAVSLVCTWTVLPVPAESSAQVSRIPNRQYIIMTLLLSKGNLNLTRAADDNF